MADDRLDMKNHHTVRKVMNGLCQQKEKMGPENHCQEKYESNKMIRWPNEETQNNLLCKDQNQHCKNTGALAALGRVRSSYTLMNWMRIHFKHGIKEDQTTL